MLELMKFVLEKIDFVGLAETLRKRNNRKAAARLHLILVQSYEIIELYRVLLDELKAALDSHERLDERHRFFLNPARTAGLLQRQASNLEVMEVLISDMLDEVRVLDNRFAEAYRSIFPGKSGILFEAQGLLTGGRLPLSESGPMYFPADANRTYKSLWFTWEAPTEDRKQVEKYLYGDNGTEKDIIDVNIHDGDAFFRQLSDYFIEDAPHRRLAEIERLTESYKEALAENFSLEEILSDIGKVRRHDNWAKREEGP